MTKTRSTKRALIMSVLALIMCVSMLVGSTFAWFTDSVTSAGNKIQAGTLDIQLLMDADLNGEYEDISDSTAPIFGAGSIAQNNNAETLWEPGKTQVAYLAIKNNGSLALKYTVVLDVKDVIKNLHEVMEYAIIADADTDNPVTSWTSGNSVVVGSQPVSGDVSLAVGATHYFALAIHMDEEAGNDYQGGEVDFDLTIMATQDTVESDSFDNQYDKYATYEDATVVSTADEVKAILATEVDGVTIVLEPGTYEGISLTNPGNYRAKNVTIIGLNGAVIEGINLNNWAPVEQSFVVDGLTIKNVTFTKSLILSTRVMSNVTVEDCDFVNDACIHQNDRAEKLTNLVVKNCSFEGDKNGTTTAIMLENTENVTVTGCTFENIDFNVLQAGVLSGTVLFDNNTVDGTGSRVFRFVTVNADVTISNNTITSDGNGNGELAMATDAVVITLENNTWNGKPDAEVADLLINITAK